MLHTSLILLAAVQPRMATIPAGHYAGIYGDHQHVAAFAIDREPVTRGDFLVFVRNHREWRRTEVTRANADASYLSDWQSDLSAGRALRLPVVNVSLFAAKAYCEAQGKRLPTTAEWERAAAASKTSIDASNDPAFQRELLDEYARRGVQGIRPIGEDKPNAFGVSDLHSLVWEWTSDFDRAAGASKRDAHPTCASAAIGATDTDNYPAFLRNAMRSGLERTSTTRSLGFRCAADL